jgi:hypothetical protein
MRQNIVCIRPEERQTMIDSGGNPFKWYEFSIALEKIKIIDGHYISLLFMPCDAVGGKVKVVPFLV